MRRAGLGPCFLQVMVIITLWKFGFEFKLLITEI